MLDRSLIVKPSEVEEKFAAKGEPDGLHRVAYDENQVFVCSKPIRLQEQPAEFLAEAIRDGVEEHPVNIASALRNVY